MLLEAITKKIDKLVEQGDKFISNGNLEEALRIFIQLRNQLQVELDKLEKESPVVLQNLQVSIDCKIAGIISKQGNLNESLTMLEEILARARELARAEGEFLALRYIANLQNERGEYEKALENYEKALETHLKSKNKHEIATILADVARTHFNRGELEQAREKFRRSLEIYKKTGIENKLVKNLCFYSELLILESKHDKVLELLEEAEKIVERHNNGIERSIVLLHFGIFEKSRENLGKAHQYFLSANKLARKHNYNHVLLRSSTFLAESNLQKYKISFNMEQYRLATTYIEEVLKISLREKIIPTLVKALIVKSALISVNLDFKESMKVLDDALGLCQQNRLKVLAKRVESQKKLIEDRMLMYRKTFEEQEKQYQDISASDEFNFIDLLNRTQTTGSSFDAGSLFLTVFKHDIKGPTVLITDELPFKDNNHRILEAMGFFFSLAIGQGHRHHEGLFGALPLANETDYSAIIYSVALGDKEQKDTRMKGKNFILFCLIYHNDLGHYFYDRFELESIFKEHVSSISDITTIKLDTLQKLKENIVEKMSYM
ncbi:MAG: tetratricopeptide repeat protein [Candidatus Hodarchaeales archaeon]